MDQLLENLRNHPPTVSQLGIPLFVICSIILFHFINPKHDPDEPPLVPHAIPLIGHLIELLFRGLAYFRCISDVKYLPIYSLHILSSRLYVVNSRELVTAIERNTKTLNFNPFITEVFRRMFGLDDQGVAVIRENMNCENGDYGYWRDMHHVIYGSLAPGKALDEMNCRVLDKISGYLNDLAKDGEQTKDLFLWIRHLFTEAGAYATFGPQSPFSLDPELEEVFWTFENNVKMLLLDFFPRFTAPAGYKARERLVAAFVKYFQGDGINDAALIVKERSRLYRQYNLTIDNQARQDLGLAFGVLLNVVPTSFWFLLYIFSSRTILADIRAEVDAALPEIPHLLIQESKDPTPHTITLKVSALRTAFPLLSSTYHEVLRTIASNTSGRAVLADTEIRSPSGQSYKLRAGGVVQIPGGVMHADERTWGDDVKEFNPRRFLSPKNTQSALSDDTRARAAGLRAFGGGVTLCPGRHFAFTEIVAFAAIMVAGWDLLPEQGEWKMPKKDNTRVPLGVLKPVNDVKVRINRRKGLEHVSWKFIAG